MNYWKECLECSLDEHAPGVITPEQIELIAKDIEHGADMEFEYSGRSCIPNPLLSEISELNRKRKEDAQRAEERERIYEKNIKARYQGTEVWVSIRDGRVEVEAAR